VALRATRRRLPISAPTGVGIFALRRLAYTNLAACVALCAGTRAPAQGLGVTDDAGRSVRLAAPAQRVVSLSPAITELLFALGAGVQVVGRTTWCDYPPAARAVPNVGDGLSPNLESILARHPDLVVLYDSPTNMVATTRLNGLGIAALLLRQDRLVELARDARILGRLTGHADRGDSVAAAISSVRQAPALGLRIAILAWQNPPTVIGGASYLDELAALAGAENVFHDLASPAAVVSLETIAARDPDALVVFADSGGAGTRPEGLAWQAIRAVRSGRIIVLVGSRFGRPSPRAGEAVVEFRRLLEAGP